MPIREDIFPHVENLALFVARLVYAHITFLRKGYGYACTDWGMMQERVRNGALLELSAPSPWSVSFAVLQHRRVRAKFSSLKNWDLA